MSDKTKTKKIRLPDEDTSIRLKVQTRNRLDRFRKKDQSFDLAIRKLIRFYDKHREGKINAV